MASPCSPLLTLGAPYWSGLLWLPATDTHRKWPEPTGQIPETHGRASSAFLGSSLRSSRSLLVSRLGPHGRCRPPICANSSIGLGDLPSCLHSLQAYPEGLRWFYWSHGPPTFSWGPILEADSRHTFESRLHTGAVTPRGVSGTETGQGRKK